MKVFLSAAQMKAADENEIARGTPSRTLMERAAKAACEILCTNFDTTHTLIVCGPGNNGGDGIAMARLLFAQGKKVSVCYTGALRDGAPDLQRASEECARQLSLLQEEISLCAQPSFDGVTAIVDAIFGIGLSRTIEGNSAAIIAEINQSRIPVLAIDIPSGINADTGAIMGIAVRAAHTVSMAAYKAGHLLYPGTMLCGKLTVADIGIPTKECVGKLLEKEDLSSLPERPPRAHKGSFGRVLIIGGSVAMSGAAYFAAKAAYRAGAGLVEILAPAENRIIYQTQLPEALLTLYDPESPDEELISKTIARADAIAIGMGLGSSPTTTKLLDITLACARCPVVLDADALNDLAASETPRLRLAACKAPLVLTPHLGEAGRLMQASIPTIAAAPLQSATALAQKFAAVVALKDARTVITNGVDIAINTYGNSGMATGGSGDVLAGVIAAFLAARVPPTDAATLGVLAHALAGDAAVQKCGSHGLMASDIIEGLCQVLP